MIKQSVNFTEPNNDWLNAQVESLEYKSKSELLNDLIRKARAQAEETQAIRAALLEGKNSGISERTPDEIMQSVLKRKKLNESV